MKHVKRSAIVPYSAPEMYRLVADVPSYEKFLPWCGGSRVLEKDADGVVASMDIAYRGVRKSFTTRNTLHPEHRIDIRLVDGPFSHLNGSWYFEPLDEQGSKVTLDLEFGFSSRLLGMAVGPVFSQIANNLVNAFRRRADAVYGAR